MIIILNNNIDNYNASSDNTSNDNISNDMDVSNNEFWNSERVQFVIQYTLMRCLIFGFKISIDLQECFQNAFFFFNGLLHCINNFRVCFNCKYTKCNW